MLFGDQVPVIRGGRSIDDVMREHVLGGEGAPAAQVVVESMYRRLPRQREAIDAALRRYRDAVLAADAVRGRRCLNALFAIAEEDVSINGDLVGARNDPDAIVRECATLGPEVTREQHRQLLLRALELDPEHVGAKTAIARLG
jgi:hypothetical protein